MTSCMEWPRLINQRLMEWLLDPSDPSVRYFTLLDLLGKEKSNAKVIAAREAVPFSSFVTKIMAKLNPAGHWADPSSPYIPKYKASYWQVLVQLGMRNDDVRIQKATEHIFHFQQQEGGFSCYGQAQLAREYDQRLINGCRMPQKDEWVASEFHRNEISCLTGNLVAALISMGYFDDPRVGKAIDWLVQTQLEDGGWQCPFVPSHLGDKHGCFMGSICALEGLSAIPKEALTGCRKRAIEKGAEFFLMHRLFKADHHGFQVIDPSWLIPRFPKFWQYDILRGLDILTKLGYAGDECLSDALEVLLQKRQYDGRWIMESAPSSAMHARIEPKGKPSKWITLIALRSLKRVMRG